MRIEFAHKELLLLLLLIPPVVWYYFRRGKRLQGSLRFPGFAKGAHPGSKVHIIPHIPFFLRILGLVALTVALARPRERDVLQEMNTRGIDIMLVLDISSSMKAMDFKPNRLEAVKKVAAEFISMRPSDRIGLVTFGKEPFLKCPLTTDHHRLQGYLREVSIVDREYDGTAIGLALASGVNRLRRSPAKSRVLILLSDGRNNAGELDPLTAAQMAKDFNIRVYTIGAGGIGPAPLPVPTPLGTRIQQVRVDIDEETLREIAKSTGGRYFRATDEEELEKVYQEINNLETSPFKVREYVQFKELFPWPLGLALLLLSLEFLLTKTVLWRFP